MEGTNYRSPDGTRTIPNIYEITLWPYNYARCTTIFDSERVPNGRREAAAALTHDNSVDNVPHRPDTVPYARLVRVYDYRVNVSVYTYITGTHVKRNITFFFSLFSRQQKDNKNTNENRTTFYVLSNLLHKLAVTGTTLRTDIENIENVTLYRCVVHERTGSIDLVRPSVHLFQLVRQIQLN